MLFFLLGFCMILFICGKLILMLFIFYSMMMVRLCECVCVCLRARWCVSGEWISEQEMCVDRVMENERENRSLFFSFSPLSPSLWIRMYRKSNGLIVLFFTLETQSYLPAASRANIQKPFGPAVPITPESTMSWNPFDRQFSDWHSKLIWVDLAFQPISCT